MDPGVIGIAFKWNARPRALRGRRVRATAWCCLHLERRRAALQARAHDASSPLPDTEAAGRSRGGAARDRQPALRQPHHSRRRIGLVCRQSRRRLPGADRARTGRVLARAEIDLPGLGCSGRIACAPSPCRPTRSACGSRSKANCRASRATRARSSRSARSMRTAPSAAHRSARRRRRRTPKLVRSRREGVPRRSSRRKTGLGPLFNARSCVACHPSRARRHEHKRGAFRAARGAHAIRSPAGSCRSIIRTARWRAATRRASWASAMRCRPRCRARRM